MSVLHKRIGPEIPGETFYVLKEREEKRIK
jgi:hypothetical protein